MLNKDEIISKAKQIKGSIKENLGWVTDDHQAECEGKVMRIKGEIQEHDAKVTREAEEAGIELDEREGRKLTD